MNASRGVGAGHASSSQHPCALVSLVCVLCRLCSHVSGHLSDQCPRRIWRVWPLSSLTDGLTGVLFERREIYTQKSQTERERDAHAARRPATRQPQPPAPHNVICFSPRAARVARSLGRRARSSSSVAGLSGVRTEQTRVTRHEYIHELPYAKAETVCKISTFAKISYTNKWYMRIPYFIND